MEIRQSILDTIGETPLVALLAAKLEFFNPASSSKDRSGVAMIEAAERAGELRPGMTIVEPTSGNTGLGLALAALIKGYKLVCTATTKISREKVLMLEAHG